MTDEKEIQESETEKPMPAKKSGQKLFRPWIAGALLVVVAAAGFFFWISGKDRGGGNRSSGLPDQVVFPVPGKKEIRFNDFLVPLPADPAHTGMSFSVVIQYRDAEWSTMTDPEKTWLRGKIYDTLVKEMENQEKPPSAEMVVFRVSRAVRELFPDRPFEEVMVVNVFML